MATITAYLPNVVAAILIFVVVGLVAAAVGGLATRTMGDTPTGKIVAAVVPVLVMGIATFMILNQLRIAPEIGQITYIALLGSVSLALALAFGLGGREAAARLLADGQQKGAEQRGQVKADLQTGKARAQSDAQTAKAKAQERTDGRASTGARPAGGAGAV